MLRNKRFLIGILAVLVLIVFSGCAETADEALEPEALNDGFDDFGEVDAGGGDTEIEITEPEIPLALWQADETDLNEYAAEVLRLVNIERQNAGFPDLLTDDALTNTAVTRAKELVTLFSHKRPDGSNCFTAYDENNVSYTAAAENIAAGQRTPEAVLTSWMNSPGHKENILNPDFGHLGVGIEIGPNETLYWSLNFTN